MKWSQAYPKKMWPSEGEESEWENVDSIPKIRRVLEVHKGRCMKRPEENTGDTLEGSEPSPTQLKLHVPQERRREAEALAKRQSRLLQWGQQAVLKINPSPQKPQTYLQGLVRNWFFWRWDSIGKESHFETVWLWGQWVGTLFKGNSLFKTEMPWEPGNRGQPWIREPNLNYPWPHKRQPWEATVEMRKARHWQAKRT